MSYVSFAVTMLIAASFRISKELASTQEKDSGFGPAIISFPWHCSTMFTSGIRVAEVYI